MLTDQQRRIIRLIAEGRTNADIALATQTTNSVAKKLVREIYDELGLWNRVEVALWYESRQGGNNETDY
jgi:DNA-binding NarL/FixJ family response regulator